MTFHSRPFVTFKVHWEGNIVQSWYLFAVDIASTTISVSVAWIIQLWSPDWYAWTTCNVILVSASSYSHGWSWLMSFVAGFAFTCSPDVVMSTFPSGRVAVDKALARYSNSFFLTYMEKSFPIHRNAGIVSNADSCAIPPVISCASFQAVILAYIPYNINSIHYF